MNIDLENSLVESVPEPRPNPKPIAATREDLPI